MSDAPDSPPPSAAAFEKAQRSSEFTDLKRTFRNFAFPMAIAFLVWYLVYVLLSTYAVGLMSTPVIGYVNLGLLISLGQFATTFLITWLYIRYMNRRVDPLAAKMRAELEAGEQ